MFCFDAVLIFFVIALISADEGDVVKSNRKHAFFGNVSRY